MIINKVKKRKNKKKKVNKMIECIKFRNDQRLKYLKRSILILHALLILQESRYFIKKNENNLFSIHKMIEI